ncbi:MULTISPECIES: hypothetical protein [Bacillaceae]|uniref:Uncharacterized protein n=1 Tax=Priestia iocasae TaxID=2291674 RepID=A0ABS2QRP0_9BACI|nr:MULTISPECIES: hypothetical protein [Bacillaceae]MBM7702116.1 hypothetical protein [Metabacillus iocasae]
MKNRDKNRKKRRDSLKDYLKNKLKNWQPKTTKGPVSNVKTSA